MELLEACLVGKAPDPLDLGLEPPTCGWLAAGVQLEFLRSSVHVGPQRANEIRVRERGGHDAARQEDRLKPFVLRRSVVHEPTPTPSLVVARRA